VGELLGRVDELGSRLVAEADADVVAEPLAHGQPLLGADPAAQQDRRRAVRARRADDGGRAKIPGGGRGPDCTLAVEQDTVDERVRSDVQVRPLACGVDVCERSVPAHVSDDVDWVQDRVVAAGLGEGAVPRRELALLEGARAQLAFRTPQVRLEVGVRPAGSPLSVVGRVALEHDAGVVRRAAAEDPRPELGAVLAVGLPRVGEGEGARIEDVQRPSAGLVGPVVGAGLDQAHRAVGVLAQPPGEHTASRPTSEHEHIEFVHGR
jgi:hypothetical protein